jgi:hypothetical protein
MPVFKNNKNQLKKVLNGVADAMLDYVPVGSISNKENNKTKQLIIQMSCQWRKKEIEFRSNLD